MREILFKGKAKFKDEWIEGFVFDDGLIDSKRLFIGSVEIIDVKDIGGNYVDIYGHCIYEVVPETVGQYTGLKDKNGREIWENDIVKIDNGFEKAISVVRYGQYSPLVFINLMEEKYHVEIKQLAHGLFYKSVEGNDIVVFDSPYVEVIGNIFDNPELLEVEE